MKRENKEKNAVGESSFFIVARQHTAHSQMDQKEEKKFLYILMADRQRKCDYYTHSCWRCSRHWKVGSLYISQL